jgi:hypothetical protein
MTRRKGRVTVDLIDLCGVIYACFRRDERCSKDKNGIRGERAYTMHALPRMVPCTVTNRHILVISQGHLDDDPRGQKGGSGKILSTAADMSWAVALHLCSGASDGSSWVVLDIDRGNHS